MILITDGKNAFDYLHVDDDADDEDEDIGSGKGEVAGGTERNDGLSRKQQLPLDMSAVAAAASSAVGSELCGKPFRWDQRLFTLLIGAGDAHDNPPDLTGPAAMALKVCVCYSPVFGFHVIVILPCVIPVSTSYSCTYIILQHVSHPRLSISTSSPSVILPRHHTPFCTVYSSLCVVLHSSIFHLSSQVLFSSGSYPCMYVARFCSPVSHSVSYSMSFSSAPRSNVCGIFVIPLGGLEFS